MQGVYINIWLFTSAHNVEKKKYDDNSGTLKRHGNERTLMENSGRVY